MRNLLNQLLKKSVIIFVFSVFFISCQREEVTNDVLTKSNFKVTKLSKKLINNNSELKIALSNYVKNKNEVNKTINSSRIILIDSLGFSIDIDRATLLEDDLGYKSYSFYIIKDNPIDNNIENLVFSLNENGEYDAYIFKYGFSLSDFLNIDMSSLQNTETEIIPLDYEFNPDEFNKVILSCIETWEWVMVDEGDQGELVGEGNTENPTFDWAITGITCFYSTSSGGDVSSTDAMDGTSTGSSGYYSGGSSSGGSSSNNSSASISSSPTLPPLEEPWVLIDIYLSNLNNPNYTTEMRDWLSNNRLNSEQINAFLQNNNYSVEAQNFVLQAIEFLIENGGSFIFDDALTNTLDFNSFTEFKNYLNTFDNSLDMNSLVTSLFSNQNGTTTTKFKAKFNNVLTPLYLNMEIVSILEDPTTLVSEFNVESVNTYLSGLTTLIDWEQTSYNYSSFGQIATVTTQGHFSYGVKILGNSGTYIGETWIITATYNNLTGQAITWTATKN